MTFMFPNGYILYQTEIVVSQRDFALGSVQKVLGMGPLTGKVNF